MSRTRDGFEIVTADELLDLVILAAAFDSSKLTNPDLIAASARAKAIVSNVKMGDVPRGFKLVK